MSGRHPYLMVTDQAMLAEAFEPMWIAILEQSFSIAFSHATRKHGKITLRSCRDKIFIAFSKATLFPGMNMDLDTTTSTASSTSSCPA